MPRMHSIKAKLPHLPLVALGVVVLAACGAQAHRGAKSAKGDVIGNESLTAKNIPGLAAGSGDDDDDDPRPTPSGSSSGAKTPPPSAGDADPRAKYAQYVAAITTTLPTWKTGAAAAVMLFNKDRNQYLPFLLDNREAAAIPRPDPSGGPGHYSFYMTSDDGGWFVMTIGSFKPGPLQCRRDNVNVAMGFKDDFAGDDPEVMWGDNDGNAGDENGWCKVELFAGKTPNDWTATVSAILVANNKEKLMRISNAFVQFRNMPVGPPAAAAGKPPAATTGTSRQTHQTGPTQQSRPAATGTATGRVRLPR